MSFSYDTKKELTEIVPEINSLSLAQCYGMLLFAKKLPTMNLCLQQKINMFVTIYQTY